MININKLVTNSIVITTAPVDDGKTRVKYTAASGHSDWEGDIVGELMYYLIPNRSDIAEVVIGSHVTSIGDSTFEDCNGLTSVMIPGSVTSIGDSAFHNCTSLTSVTIPDSVTSIEYWAFYGCSSLMSVTIGNSVTSIGNQAFYYCSSLTSITIPDSVTNIDFLAFGLCDELTSVTFSGKDMATVQGMTNYSWELPSGCTIHCTDGDITL